VWSVQGADAIAGTVRLGRGTTNSNGCFVSVTCFSWTSAWKTHPTSEIGGTCTVLVWRSTGARRVSSSAISLGWRYRLQTATLSSTMEATSSSRGNHHDAKASWQASVGGYNIHPGRTQRGYYYRYIYLHVPSFSFRDSPCAAVAAPGVSRLL
jgi:hypothetical protein